MKRRMLTGLCMYIHENQCEWKYEVGDRTLEPGLFDHYRTIVGSQVFYLRYDAHGQAFYEATPRFWGEPGQAFYLTFDTSLRRGYPAYTWVDAAEFEKKSNLDFRPPAELVPTVLAKAGLCVQMRLPYSVPKQTDCDSLTRWLYTNERWNKQMATTVGGLVLSTLAFAIADSIAPQKHRRR